MAVMFAYFVGVLAGLGVGILAAYEANGWETSKWKQWLKSRRSSKP